VILWREAVRRRGLKALTAKPAPGPSTEVDGRAAGRLPASSCEGPRPGISTPILDHRTDCHRRSPTFGVRLHRAHVGRLLTTLGWSCQKPERRAVERDDAAIARWKRIAGSR